MNASRFARIHVSRLSNNLRNVLSARISLFHFLRQLVFLGCGTDDAAKTAKEGKNAETHACKDQINADVKSNCCTMEFFLFVVRRNELLNQTARGLNEENA